MFRYVEGDLFAAIENAAKPVVLPHVVNDQNAMGSGFVVPLMRRFPQVPKEYHELGDRGGLVLGHNQYVNTRDGVTVVNMIAQTLGGLRPLFYNHLVACMEKLAEMFETGGVEGDIHAPLFGAGLAGGSWAVIEPLIEDCWCRRGHNVTIYYLPGQKPRP